MLHLRLKLAIVGF